MEEIGIVEAPKEDTGVPEKKSPALTSAYDELDSDDMYVKYKKLQQQLEFLEVQEEYIKDEMRNLRKEYIHAQEEVKRIQSVPLVIGQFLEAVDQNTGIVGSTTGSNYYVRILSTLDRELLKPSASVALHKHSNALVDVLPPEADSSISMLGADEKPDVSYADIGGMDMQKQEMREAVELPLSHFDLYKQIGIDPPRGVLMYGPPGCGKTMLAKATAREAAARFINLDIASLTDKWYGESQKLAGAVFTLARKIQPCIIFIDEIDSLLRVRTQQDHEATAMIKAQFMQLWDGLSTDTNSVVVIGATNRPKDVDTAILRRMPLTFKLGLPDRSQRREIISVYCSPSYQDGSKLILIFFVHI